MGHQKRLKKVEVRGFFDFIPGNIKNCYDEWAKLTTNSYILSIVRHGLLLDFIEHPDLSYTVPTHNFSPEQKVIISTEVNRLATLKVITPATLKPNSFLSNIFTTPKKDNVSHRFILNLKQLNTQIKYLHFKLESISDVLNMILPGVWMASIDLKDAYYSIPIHPAHQCKLSFSWDGVIYEFTCLPNGYTQGPYAITKLFKIPFGFLRSQGYPSVFYFDDSYLQGNTYESCFDNVNTTVNLLQRLGFTINIDKSVLVPTQEIEFLGFVLNSVSMTITITSDRRQKLIRLCSELMSNDHHSIRFVTATIGAMVSALLGIKYGALYYRALETCRNRFLKLANLDYDAPMTLSPDAKVDVQWWLDNVQGCYNVIHPPPVVYTFFTDASLEGWGGTDGHCEIGGRWSQKETLLHINALELTAAKLVTMSLAKQLRNCHIKLMLDNTTAIAYVNKMGGTHSWEANKVAKELWEWAKSRDIWLSAAHIPGVQNTVADFRSRNFKDNTEWSLPSEVFQQITACFFPPMVDLFASRLNFHVHKYVSWKPDPEAWAVDAFTFSWEKLNFYAFPPFSLVGKVLRKIQVDRADGLMVVPLWTTQSWFPLLLGMLVEHPRVIQPGPGMLILHGTTQCHPLCKALRLLVVHLSGEHCKVSTYQQTLSNSLAIHGDLEHWDNMSPPSKDGEHFVWRGKLIPMLPL